MKEQDSGVKWFHTYFYPQKKTARAVRYEDGILPRLREKNITLFTPWGPRYSWERRGAIIQEGDKEIKTMNFLAELFGELKRNMPDKNFRWVILGADLYGTRINNLPIDITLEYFESLAGWLHQILPIAEFQVWSQFDDSAERYRQMVRENFDTLVSEHLLSRANQTAQAMERNGSATDYLVERFAEAMFVEGTLKPIKISCAPRHKDDSVDWELPRLYFLPDSLHVPWL